MSIPSYGKVWNLGHGAVKEIFLHGPVVLQEKVDGSQFSFMVDGDFGDLHMRSKGREVHPGAPDKLFRMAADTVVSLYGEKRLTPGYIYRAEAITSPRHNVITYSRIPEGGLIIFDIETSPGEFLLPGALSTHVGKLGLESVPCFGEQIVTGPEDLKAFLDRESCLGGAKIEGVVAKAYGMYTRDGKLMMAKYVSEAFKEKHKREWKNEGGKKDILQTLQDSLCTEARWQKAVQHLRENGTLTDSPKDIGPLMAEICRDTEEEEKDWIIEKLWEHFRKPILRGVGRGFPEWYKSLLLEKQFEEEEPEHVCNNQLSPGISSARGPEGCPGCEWASEHTEE